MVNKHYKFTPVVLLFTSFSCLLMSCSSSPLFSSGGAIYQYHYRLTSPDTSEDLFYKDNNIYVKFLLDESAIRFQLQNISPENAEILWERTSIGVNNKTFPVRNSRNLYADSLCNLTTFLPPLGYTVDLIIPARNFYYDGRRWKERPFFPTNVMASFPETTLIGNQITLNMPIRLAQEVKEYSFDFVVSKVDKIPRSQYHSPKRPPPPRRSNFETSDQIITAAAVAVIVAMSSIFLTQKKIPPSK